MKYLKLFETITQYESFKDSDKYVMPNVSLIINTDTDEVKVVKFHPKEDTHIGIPNNEIHYIATEQAAETSSSGKNASVTEFILNINLVENANNTVKVEHIVRDEQDGRKYCVIKFDKDIEDLDFSLFYVGSNQLKEIILPSSISKIAGNLFGVSHQNLGSESLQNIESITCYAKTAPKISGEKLNVHTNLDLPFNGVLYYPKGSDYSSWIKALPECWTTEEI